MSIAHDFSASARASGVPRRVAGAAAGTNGVSQRRAAPANSRTRAIRGARPRRAARRASAPDRPTAENRSRVYGDGKAMPWLADTDVGAAHGFARALLEARTVSELRRRALLGLAKLVPADVLTWDRVELDTGAVRHEAIPADAEPPGAFAAVVGDAAGHPLLSAHAARKRSALRLSEAVEPRSLSHTDLYGDLLHPSGVEYSIAIAARTERGEMIVAGLGRTERQFSERDRDLLDLVLPCLERRMRDTQARERLVRAVAADPPPGTAVMLLDRYGEIEHSTLAGERWLAEHFGAAEHAGWLPEAVAAWLALPPRPPLVSVRDGRRLTIHLLPGDPHALLLE